MVKRFNVVIAKPDGGVEVYPMKQWLRDHSEHIPQGLDATSSTSHQLRDALRRAHWSVQETPSEVRLSPPGGASDVTIDAVLGDDESIEEAESADTSFAMEFQLRDFIAQNIASIEVNGKRLRLYVDPAGRDGIEYPTAVGPIDILAVDSAETLYVFELKRARSPDHAMGQLTRYMGWVKQTIGKDHDVRGVIVAKEISNSLKYAVAVVPNVSLFEYAVQFQLKPADQI